MLDELIHQPLRLKIMAALWADRTVEPLEFGRLKTVTGATDGNLGSHLTALEKAGYVAIAKDFVGKRPRTRVSLTTSGGRAFRGHVEYLRQIIEEADGERPGLSPP
ncbi:transcriptional regulator [Brevundimonas sp. LM2]|uniref:winged helix-turn-helix domain-containing protein n=1 Tax=Brevundimonas sp. LM2 TaxID=1938605 RepID=UPI00098399A8|nr:transcriptional regulator [Brevundimonas sp. LM2]AQR60435.1 transcriptional regulator [Brevundimonas sp. LM2]